MAELATSAGLPRPEIEDAGGYVTVCFRHGEFVPSRRSGSDVIERQEAILALLDRAEGGLALREIHAQLPLDVSERQVRRALTELRDRGLARAVRDGTAAALRQGQVEALQQRVERQAAQSETLRKQVAQLAGQVTHLAREYRTLAATLRGRWI